MPTTSTSRALSIDQLCIAYGHNQILHGVSLDIVPGEIVALVGPNGAGKTSMVHAVTGQLRPSAGAITIAGKPLRPRRAHLHSLGFTPQALGLYPHLTARENLQVLGRMTGVGKRQLNTAVDECLVEMALEPQAEQLARQLSGGMQRRLHLGATLLANPKLIILDEPTAGVDLAARQRIQEVVHRRALGGAAILLVTHELQEVQSHCHRVAMLHGGHLLADAEPERLINQTFGCAQWLRVHTAPNPPQVVTGTLQSLGLSVEVGGAEVDGECWTGQTEKSSLAFFQQLHDGLGEHVNQVRELLVRKPGLVEVMATLTQRQKT